MGLSASQARLLTLTARLSDLELRAQQISNSKMRLSTKSEEVSKTYSDALAKEQLTYKSSNTSGDTTYSQVTANQFLTYDDTSSDSQRILQDSYGRILVSQTIADNYQNSSGDLEKFLNTYGYTQYSAATLENTYHASVESGLTTSLTGNLSDVLSTMTSTETPTTTVSMKSTYSGWMNVVTEDYNAVLDNGPDNFTSSIGNLESALSQFYYSSYESAVGNAWSIASQADQTYENSISSQEAAGSTPSTIDAFDEAYSVLTQIDLSALAEAISTTTYGTDTTYATTMTKDQLSTELKSMYDSLKGVSDSLTSTDLTSYLSSTLNKISSLITETGTGTDAASTTAATDVANYLKGFSISSLTAVLDKASLTNSATAKAVGTYTYNQDAVSYYSNLFESMGNGTTNTYVTAADSCLSNSTWLYDQLKNGNLTISKYNTSKDADGNTTGAFALDSIASDSYFVESTDDSDTAKAQAAYEAGMAEVEAKDNKFDLQLNNINTEHSSVQTEIDSVKKVLDKNIDRSFKIFNA